MKAMVQQRKYSILFKVLNSFNMWLQIICSSILHGTDVIDTGL